MRELEIFRGFNITDVIDILFVAVVVYQIILIIRGTRAIQILFGLAFIFVLYLVSGSLELNTLHWVLDQFLGSIILVIVVLFQADIRRALARFGKYPFASTHYEAGEEFVDELVRSINALVHRRIGAILVIERETGLSEYIEEGVKLDAEVCRELIVSIFLPSSPIHDGAVIIRKGRIVAAGCFFPLATDIELEKDLGTRHRAAIGVSEETDAVVLVVSEERAEVSLVFEGRISFNLSSEELSDRLHRLLG
jgi:diadenylate cyclase